MTHSDSNLGASVGSEQQLRAALSRLQWVALLVGVAGLLVCVAAAASGEQQRELFYRSYLFAYAFWLGLSLGSGAIAMIHNLTAGRWGQAARRVIEAANANVILMAVMGLPLLYAINTKHMYGWAGYGPDPHLGPHKAMWLTPQMVTTRACVCFAIWIITSLMIRIGSARMEKTRSFAVAKVFAALSAIGLILYVLSLTATIVDWVMSLTPDWYSTMFTLIFMMGQVLSAFCVTVLVSSLLIRYEPVRGKISKDQFNDLSSFMFAFTVLWAYMSFAQFLISWMGHLKPESAWYAARINNPRWLVVGLSLMFLQFLLPFLILLNKPIKRNPEKLIKIAAWIIFMRFIDLMYLIKPGFTDHRVSWMDFVMPFGIGGIYVFAFLFWLKSRKLEPPPLVDERTAVEVSGPPGLIGATEYGAAITGRKGPVP